MNVFAHTNKNCKNQYGDGKRKRRCVNGSKLWWELFPITINTNWKLYVFEFNTKRACWRFWLVQNKLTNKSHGDFHRISSKKSVREILTCGWHDTKNICQWHWSNGNGGNFIQWGNVLDELPKTAWLISSKCGARAPFTNGCVQCVSQSAHVCVCCVCVSERGLTKNIEVRFDSAVRRNTLHENRWCATRKNAWIIFVLFLHQLK